MIRKRFLVYFLLLSAITVIATVAFEAWSFRRAIDHSLNQNLLFARSVAQVIGGLVDQEKVQVARLHDESARLLGSSNTVEDPKALAALMKSVRAATLDNDGAVLFDAGRQLIAADIEPAGLPPSDVLMPALRRAEATDGAVVTDLWKGQDHRPRIAVVRGRTTGQGKNTRWRAAVVYIRLDGPNFERLFSYFLVNEQSRLQLLDSTGVALFSTLPAERYGSVVHGTYFTDKVRLGGVAQMQCHSCHKKGHDVTVRESEVTTVAPVPGTDWTVTVREGTRDLFEPMQETVYASSALVSLIFGCFVGFYLLLSRRVLRPMRQLAETANALATGGDMTPIAKYAQDEFALLALSFEAMRARSRPVSGSVPVVAPVPAVSLLTPTRPLPDLAQTLGGLVEGVAASRAVSSVLLHLRGAAAIDGFFRAEGITVRSEGPLGAALEAAAAGRVQVPIADLEARGIAVEDKNNTRLFYVQRIRIPDSLEGELWIGVSDGSEAMGRYLGPTLAVIGGQVQSLVERSLLYEQLRIEQDHKNRMLRHLFDAESEERKYIAREIHDETAQELTALLLQLEAFPEDMAPQAEANLAKAKLLVSRILQGLNRLVRRLRPAVLDDMGLVEGVRATGLSLLESAGIAFDLEVEGDDVDLPREVESTVYRVFQEAATNIVRHAGAKRVMMRLRVEPDRLMGWIEDDGRGMDPSGLDVRAKHPRWGLLGMRERIVQMGGTIEFATATAGGLRIVFDVPLTAEGGLHGDSSSGDARG